MESKRSLRVCLTVMPMTMPEKILMIQAMMRMKFHDVVVETIYLLVDFCVVQLAYCSIRVSSLASSLYPTENVVILYKVLCTT